MTAMMPGQWFLPAGLPRPTVGSWRVDPARSQASFAARVAGRPVDGRLPLAGRVAGRPVGGRLPLAGRMLMAEPIEDSTVRLAARTSAISTGSPWLDRLLAGPGFLDAGAFPEIGFRSELLAWVPAGWRAVGRLRVKNTEHELACELDLHQGGMRPGGSPCIIVASSLVIDSQWVTRQLIPALGRRIVMTCSVSLEPDM